MTQLPLAGPSLRVPAASIPLPTGPTIGEGIAAGVGRAADAVSRLADIQRQRRLDEIEVKDIEFLGDLRVEALQESLTGDVADADRMFDNRVQARRGELRQIQDGALRSAALARFGGAAARTGASLRSALVVREGERMQAAHEAFEDQTRRAIEAETISVEDAVELVRQRRSNGIGVYLSPEQVELRVGQVQEEFEQAAGDAARGRLVELSVELTDAHADSETDEQRAEFRSAFSKALDEAVSDRLIGKDEAARRLVAFDQLAKGKVLEEITSLRSQLSDAVALSDLIAIDRIATRTGELPESNQRTTLESEIMRAEDTVRTSIDGADILLRIFGSGQPMPIDAPKSDTARNGAYNTMRAAGIDLTTAMDFFAQDSVLPSQLQDDARELFDPEGPTFSIEEGMNVLESVYGRSRDAARRLVAEDRIMKTALAAGVQGDAKMRQDAMRLLGAGTAGRRMSELDRAINPKTEEDRKHQIDVTELLKDNDGVGGTPRLVEEQRDLFAGLLALEYLRGRIELGETETSVRDTAQHAANRAGPAFLRLRNGTMVGGRTAVYYDPRLIGANIEQFEAALNLGRRKKETIGRTLFSPHTLIPLTGLMVKFSDTEVLVPTVDASGIRKIMVFDTTEGNFEKAATFVTRDEPGFEQLATFIVQANRGASFDPLGHLRRQPGDPPFPTDSVALEYLQTARRMLAGLELPNEQLRQQTELLAERLARQRKWDGLFAPDPE